jgi:hypothetical protein
MLLRCERLEPPMSQMGHPRPRRLKATLRSTSASPRKRPFSHHHAIGREVLIATLCSVASLLAQLDEAPNCEQRSNNKAYPRDRHGYGEWSNLYRPSINYSHDVGYCHDGKDQCRNCCIGGHFILSHYAASEVCRCGDRRQGPLTAEELTENAAAIGPEHQHHTHQRASGHHTRGYRQGELFGELRFPSLEQERN